MLNTRHRSSPFNLHIRKTHAGLSILKYSVNSLPKHFINLCHPYYSELEVCIYLKISIEYHKNISWTGQSNNTSHFLINHHFIVRRKCGHTIRPRDRPTSKDGSRSHRVHSLVGFAAHTQTRIRLIIATVA